MKVLGMKRDYRTCFFLMPRIMTLNEVIKQTIDCLYSSMSSPHDI